MSKEKNIIEITKQSAEQIVLELKEDLKKGTTITLDYDVEKEELKPVIVDIPKRKGIFNG